MSAAWSHSISLLGAAAKRRDLRGATRTVESRYGYGGSLRRHSAHPTAEGALFWASGS